MAEKRLINNKIILEILEKYRTIWALGYFSNLAYWDLNTYMPKGGINARGEALSQMETLSQKLFLDKNFVDLINKAEKERLNDYEKGIIRTLKRELKKYQKLPPEFIEEFTKITSTARLVWKTAREQNNFSLFEPYLEKIVELCRKKAEYLGYKKHPYDALLDEFEEGLTTDEVEKYFNSIKEPLINLIKRIKNSQGYKSKHPLEDEEYEIEKMKKLEKKILEVLNYNPSILRLDISPHPFTAMLSSDDVRITTRHEKEGFIRSLSSTVHEFGHALYALQASKGLEYTPILNCESTVLHESQSRFWEKMVASSKEFIKLIYKEISELGKNIKNYSIDEICRCYNLVKPSLIRTGADEVTYHLHILIRFELERDLIAGKIQVKDLPRMWNEKYERYLGVKPKEDSDGVLQDIHWSQGSIGYFPTYSIGSALSAMWKNKLEKDIGKINDVLNEKDGIKRIQEWLKENIHQYGSTYTFKDLVKKVTKEDFNPKYFLSYLENKYKDIYSL